MSMIRVWIDVVNDDVHFSVTVCAESPRQAVEFTADRHPGHVVRVRFPLDPDTYFVKDSAVEAEVTEPARRPRRASAASAAADNLVR
jgi:hypothetical protein